MDVSSEELSIEHPYYDSLWGQVVTGSLIEDLHHLWKEYRALFTETTYPCTFILVICFPATTGLYRTHGLPKSKVQWIPRSTTWSTRHKEESWPRGQCIFELEQLTRLAVAANWKLLNFLMEICLCSVQPGNNSSSFVCMKGDFQNRYHTEEPGIKQE